MKVIERKENWTNKLNTTEPDGMMTKMRLMVMGMMVMVRKYTDKPESTEPDSHPDNAASTRGSTPACSHLQSTQEADKGISLAHSSQMSIHQPGRQPPSSKGSWTKNLKTINMDYHCHHFHWKYKDLWKEVKDNWSHSIILLIFIFITLNLNPSSSTRLPRDPRPPILPAFILT